MTKHKKYFVLYDNLCLMCGRGRRIITALDWFSRIETVPLYDTKRLMNAQLPVVATEELLKEIHLIETDGTILKGFYACRKIGLLMPLTFPFSLFLYVPGIPYLGERIYRHIANKKEY